MVLFFGWHSGKMYMHDKPVKFDIQQKILFCAKKEKKKTRRTSWNKKYISVAETTDEATALYIQI